MERVLDSFLESKPGELLQNWYVKGINRKIHKVKCEEKISPEEAATRVLESVLLTEEPITMAKKIKVYGFHKNSKIHSFDPIMIAANAGYFSLKN
jgi:hypothetical protein